VNHWHPAYFKNSCEPRIFVGEGLTQQAWVVQNLHISASLQSHQIVSVNSVIYGVGLMFEGAGE
jgi:hypothetical protein